MCFRPASASSKKLEHGFNHSDIMNSVKSGFALLLLFAPLCVCGAEFPLEFRTLEPAALKDRLKWGYGCFASLRTEKPASLKTEAPARSKSPLYGELTWPDEPPVPFRLDESGGPGTGYDRLLLDLNRNGDLTDDTEFAPGPDIRSWSQDAETRLLLFGPIRTRADNPAVDRTLVYYAMVSLRNDVLSELRSGPRRQMHRIAGSLRLRPGWYLEVTVTVGGTTQTVAIVDNNANLRLGDLCMPEPELTNEWILTAGTGDRFVTDRATFGISSINEPFAELLYIGFQPYRVELSSDWKTLRVEPWPGPLAHLSLHPRGHQIEWLHLFLQDAAGRWQLVGVPVTNGAAWVPAAQYGLMSVVLRGKNKSGETLKIASEGQPGTNTFVAGPGSSNTLVLGPPLMLHANVETRVEPDQYAPESKLGSLLRRLFVSRQHELVVRATVLGQGGEQYGGFWVEPASAARKRLEPGPRVVVVVDKRQVYSGNLEFG